MKVQPPPPPLPKSFRAAPPAAPEVSLEKLMLVDLKAWQLAKAAIKAASGRA
jgi:hypothetical protein